MSFLAKATIHILANCLAILAADRLIEGFVFWGNWVDLIIAGAFLGLVNSVIRPVLKLLAFPLIFLTLGLFSLFINIILLFLVSNILPTIQINGLAAAFWGVIVISIVNSIIISLAKPKRNNE